jgi:hemolysin III
MAPETRPRHAPSATLLPALAPGRRIRRAELVSFLSHAFGAVAAVAGTAALVAASATPAVRAAALVYGLAMIFMFSASALYHALKDVENGASVWRKVDHLAIFFMIAGTFTPLAFTHLTGAWRWSILGVQWGLVAAGLVFKLVWVRAPRWLTTGIYLVMGWMAVVPLRPMLLTLDAPTAALLVAGGGAYTVGALIYAWKRPNPVPGLLGFHEIFHGFVLLGAALHYAAILRSVA